MRVTTGIARRRSTVLMIAAIAVTIAVFAVLWAVYNPKSKYEPPEFETNAAWGIPEPPENIGFSAINARGVFNFWIADTLYRQEDDSLRVFFTNPKDSDVLLMCDITDADGETLYKSGVLRPGQYIDSLYPEAKLKDEAIDIKVNVYAFDAANYYSMGTVTLENILQMY